ncbi:putative phosphatase YqaB [Bacteriovorax sp. BSW11_IV]|uniref:HAD family hydrolase n=1 Tax=Bacteriovorax sp. BSW11_IV TaxID=1353529 RepID=UPI00038A2E21|nr:HAD family phosphatase [Bacteriovorax sp. BSW11_IV]EQC48774.1 putative phosphatase YqaB [Bacteriovorax sp. BSW11_IV]
MKILEAKKLIELEEIISTYPKVTTLLFDMDGTIINTEILHAKAIVETIAHFENKAPLSADEITHAFCGMPDNLVFFKLQQDHALFPSINFDTFVERKNLELNKYLNSENLIPSLLVGIDLFLQKAKNEGFKIALVTASERSITHTILENSGLKQYFDRIITRQDTKNSKPEPDPYLHALESLGSNASEAIVFEDSVHGIEAATKARVQAIIKALWF